MPWLAHLVLFKLRSTASTETIEIKRCAIVELFDVPRMLLHVAITFILMKEGTSPILT
ncbi:MAG: hypothetical protein R3D51_12795 [Hyphomicrobiaceae bacterium]